MPYKKLQNLKNLFLFIILLLTYSFSLYYVSKQATFIAHAWSTWYSSSWRYRRTITVVNPGSAGSYDVLVQLVSPYDPYTLYTAGKLQSDCDDFLFTLGDDTATLSFWLESGCNTTSNSTTQIWVRIPSLASGTSYINMYYANPSATNAEASWTGNFVLMKPAISGGSGCPTGWTYDSAFYDRMPYPTSSYGTTGGNDHTHSASCTPTGQSTSKGVTTGSAGYLAKSDHEHASQTCSVQAPSDLPPFRTMHFCSNSDLNIPSGIVTYFTSTPSGWTRDSSLDNRFPLGYSSNIFRGETGGSTTHKHLCNAVSTGDTNSYALGADINNSAVDRYHGHTATGYTSSGLGTLGTTNAVNVPLYRTMIFASKDSDGPAVAGLISMTTAAPPLGWTRYSDQDGRYPYGSSTAGSLGGDAAAHTHSVYIQPSYKANDNEGDDGSDFNGCTGHSHTGCTDTTSSSNFAPPYIYTLFYQRNTSLSTSVGSEEFYNTFPNAPTDLLTEGATNPQKITDLTPEFSAVFSDSDTGNTGNYYQIEVNSQSDFLGTSMWDSTKTATGPITNGSRSSDISYAGTTLVADATVYYWRIKFWDNLNEASAWSSTGNFATSAPPNAPTDLLTDGNTDPLFILSLTPSFSAIHTDPNGDSAVYYRIEVNTQSDFLGTSMWDSTKTSTTSISNGSRSSDFVYAGTTLTSNGVTYYWHIKFWDTDDNEGSWSDTANFKAVVNRQSFKGVSLKGISVD